MRMVMNCVYMFVILNASIPAIAQPVVVPKEGSIPVLTGHIVLSFPYRDARNDIDQASRGVGFFQSGYSQEIEKDYTGKMIATDWKANVYLYDPVIIKNQIGLIKKFDRHGRFVNSWVLNQVSRINDSVVTRNGMIWVGISEEGYGLGGLPIMAYQPGMKAPVINWRRHLPSPIQDFFIESVGKEKLQEIEGQSKIEINSWALVALSGGGNTVRIQLMNSSSSNLVDIAATFAGDGKRLVELGHGEDPRTTGTQLSPTGIVWNITIEGESRKSYWEKLQLWKQGQKKQTILVHQDIVTSNSWWQKTFKLEGSQFSPSVTIDGSHNLYLQLKRRVKGVESTFDVEKRKQWVFAGREKALVVTNPQHEVIGYLPWRKSYVLSESESIFPLPDGTGFYRQEFTDKGLQIYFHPLTKVKKKP